MRDFVLSDRDLKIVDAARVERSEVFGHTLVALHTIVLRVVRGIVRPRAHTA